MREKVVCWTLVGLACLIAGQAALDGWRRIGQAYPGFGVMNTLLVGAGGVVKSGLQPFDLVRAMNGRLLSSGEELQAEIQRHPAGTKFHYILNRRGQLIEAEVASRRLSRADFDRYLLEGLLPALLFIAMGATVLWLKPGVRDTRLFLAFCLTWSCLPALYGEAHTAYRLETLFLTAFALSPAIFIHLALTFPARRRVIRRYPRLVWAPYLLSAIIAVWLHWPDAMFPLPWNFMPAAVGAVYWGAALIVLILSLARTSMVGPTPLVRQRARVLVTGFAVGMLAPVLGTAVEAVFRVTVPYLNELWRLNLLFPLAVAYAMLRYNLFNLRDVLRMGTIYGATTGLVVLAYATSITVLDVSFAALGVAQSTIVSSIVLSLAVVLLLNPVYRRIQAVVDGLFFRQRLDVQRSVERLAENMITMLDLHRIIGLIGGTVEESFHPARVLLMVLDEREGEYRPVTEPSPRLSADGPLCRCLVVERGPVTRERLEEDPAFRPVKTACLAELDALDATLVIPVFFRHRLTGLLVLGDKRSGAAYSTEDLRLLRVVANQSAVALENAKAYAALEGVNSELRAALRRVEILESIRANLAKFVPRTVQQLIEQAPEAPALGKREQDVSVLFVDIAGYTRLSERLDTDRVNDLVERYFGAFLDEIIRRGGDVNETAGDGLMVIFQHADPARHARAAVETALAILRRAEEINAQIESLDEAIALRVGVNSGVAAVGATKIEGTMETRWTYTASGPVTNVAARLASLGEKGGIFIGPETWRRLDDASRLEDLGEQRLRNVEEPIRVFRIAAAGT